MIVPLAQQTGATFPEQEIFSRWGWVEPYVWTARMLTTLEQGVEGGKWFRLFDKMFSERNLAVALQQVAKNKGAPGVSTGEDHVRWPNAFFVDRGLFSLKTAHDSIRQSSGR